MTSTSLRDCHGIVLLDKPLGQSSNQVLQTARRLLHDAKGGHTGALDPLATGMLPLCFGEATKLAGTLLGARKAYWAECQLGITTTTADREGQVLQERRLPALTPASLEAALDRFRGRILQVPPMHSALKREGEPLYLKARRGEHIDIAAREVAIHELTLVALDGDRLQLRVTCGPGTYIRSLAVDLGEALGCGAHLSALRRLWVEPFEGIPMITLDELQRVMESDVDAAAAWLLPVEAGTACLPAIRLNSQQTLAVRQGQRIRIESEQVEGGLCTARFAVFGDHGRLVALANLDGQRLLRAERGFNLPLPGSSNL